MGTTTLNYPNVKTTQDTQGYIV